jgi:hypothetical protein
MDLHMDGMRLLVTFRRFNVRDSMTASMAREKTLRTTAGRLRTIAMSIVVLR